MNGGAVSDLKKIPHGRGNIDAGALVHRVFWEFLSEDILPVVSDPWTAILPLGVADFGGLGGVDLNPPTLADCVAGIRIVALPPGDDPGRLRFVVGMIQAVVVGKGDVKWVLLRSEGRRDIAIAGTGIRVVVASVILHPFLIPGRFIVWGRIVGSGSFTDPEDGRGDVFFPRIQRFLSPDRIDGFGNHGDFRAVLGCGLQAHNEEADDSSRKQRRHNREKI